MIKFSIKKKNHDSWKKINFEAKYPTLDVFDSNEKFKPKLSFQEYFFQNYYLKMLNEK